MPGHRNMFSVAAIHDAVKTVKTNAQEMMEHAKDNGIKIRHVDLCFQFIGANNIPKMDVIGSADPYFIAKLDDKITFVSTVKSDTLAPVWNELWKVKNVPSNATLHVRVMDKDSDKPTDDYIGKFETTVNSGTKEVEIQGPILHRIRGNFWFKIESKPSDEEHDPPYPYLFDGPIRFSRHFSPTVGHLTNLNDARLYSTWKMFIKGIPKFFGDKKQHWNRNYKAAQSIFQGPTSIVVRSGIQAGHRMLYARTVNNGFGVINGPADIHALLKGERKSGEGDVEGPHRVKPAVYTYIISAEDDSFRFSETGAAFFVDFASKHALHSNCAEYVRYSGEFHPRPVGGWENFSDDKSDEEVEWELVIDNNSGTYSPDKALLPQVKALLEYNFPGFGIVAIDHDNPDLKKSTDATRAYALSKRGVKETELSPHIAPGEETLSHHASLSSTHIKEKAESTAANAANQVKVDAINMVYGRPVSRGPPT